MLSISGLNKSYGRTQVLKNINLNLEENKIYGLLGRNGAGKTTLLKLISNQIPRNSGAIRLDDKEVFENLRALEQISLARELPSSIKEKKIKEILALARILFKNWDSEYEKFLIQEFNLNTNKKLLKLSTGNQTIVNLIIGLASRARITMFDEPTIGLDAAMRSKFYNLLLEDYEKHPRTIIISTHLIDEVANLFEEIIILSEQQIILKESVANLKEKSYYLTGREDLLEPLLKDKEIIHQEIFGGTKIVGIFSDLSQGEKTYLKENNLEISKIPLQKLFIYLTEKR